AGVGARGRHAVGGGPRCGAGVRRAYRGDGSLGEPRRAASDHVRRRCGRARRRALRRRARPARPGAPGKPHRRGEAHLSRRTRSPRLGGARQRLAAQAHRPRLGPARRAVRDRVVRHRQHSRLASRRGAAAHGGIQPRADGWRGDAARWPSARDELEGFLAHHSGWRPPDGHHRISVSRAHRRRHAARPRGGAAADEKPRRHLGGAAHHAVTGARSVTPATLRRALVALCVAAAACGRHPAPLSRDAQSPDDAHRRLPTGVSLDPAGASTPVGQMPLAMALSPDGSRLVLLLSGWREEGIQVVDRASGRVVQTLAQPSAFVGLAFAPDGSSLYASGADGDLVYRYDWRGDTATLADSLPLGPHPGRGREGRRYPAGLAVAPNGRLLYAAENVDDSLAVIDLAARRVVQRLPAGRYPYGVTVTPDGAVYVSSWGANTVWAYAPGSDGRLSAADTIRVARHPSAMIASRDGARLYVVSATTDRVSVVDTKRRKVIGELRDPPPAGPAEGSTPNALALSPDGRRLFVAEADANAVAVFDVSGGAAPLGRIPVDWYPSAILAAGDTILVANGKGTGTAPNPGGPTPAKPAARVPRSYTLGQLTGTLTTIVRPLASPGALAQYTARVARANHWDRPASARGAGRYPPFTHVIYIIKENRTYDQVLGDLPQADGDTALLFFPRAVSPNHHALAERFGIFDRFFTNAEVSAQGHNWSTAAYASDYVEKTVPAQYSDRRPYYDYEGANRDQLTDDDVASPSTGYLWNLAQRAGVSFRNYGEFVVGTRELTGRR